MIKLSTMFRNPVLRAAFERAERDGDMFEPVENKPTGPVLTGGAAAVLEAA